MSLSNFREPVRILVGLGFPRDIRGPLDALVYLDQVPAGARNGAFTMASNACRAALLDEIDLETARSTFEAYARKHDLLLPEIDVVAVSAARKHDPHMV
ncbi:DUF982 domain-containing protein [bacterium]|nr:MAG: DUF982 domain-containing protein [bacterium]